VTEEDKPVSIHDGTAVTIPIRNLIAIAVGICLFLAQFFVITNRIGVLEEANRRDIEAIKKNTEFSTKWPTGALGFAPQDITQDIRLDHVEADVVTIYRRLNEHKDEDSLHAREHNHD